MIGLDSEKRVNYTFALTYKDEGMSFFQAEGVLGMSNDVKYSNFIDMAYDHGFSRYEGNGLIF